MKSTKFSVAAAFAFLITLIFLVIYPIRVVGFVEYVYCISKVNPKIASCLNWYLSNKAESLSYQWINNFELVEPIIVPDDYWVEDVATSKGVESFYLRDQYSEDCRNLLLPSYNLPCDKDAILKARLTGKYFYSPEFSPEAVYHKMSTVGGIRIETDSNLDTWIYLPAKEKQPSIYALDFDFITDTATKETLQIGFLMTSLADRFRFMVKDNKVLKFDIWKSGFSLGFDEEIWKKFEKPFSIPIGESIHVRLEVINDVYQISFNGRPEMTIKANEYERNPAYWSLIFWNGNQEEKDIRINISDFRVFHHLM